MARVSSRTQPNPRSRPKNAPRKNTLTPNPNSTWTLTKTDWHKRHYPTLNCDTWGSWDFNTSAFPNPAAFIEWLHTSQNPLGHPLAVSLNVHPETGVYSCLDGYLAFTRSVGADPSQNATVPCDMSNSTWAKALFDVFYSAPPLSGVDWFWTDYKGCTNSSAPGQPQPLGWSNLVYAEARAFGGQLRPMTFSRWGGMGSHRYPIGFSGDTFQHELTLDFEVRMTPLADVPDVDAKVLEAMVAVAFSQRRKILRHTLGHWIEENGIDTPFDLQRRAEEVPVAEYLALARLKRP